MQQIRPTKNTQDITAFSSQNSKNMFGMLGKNEGGKGNGVRGVDDLGAVGPFTLMADIAPFVDASVSDDEDQTEFNPSRFSTCNSVFPYGCCVKNPFCRSMVIIKIDTSKLTFDCSPESGTNMLANTRMVCCSTSQTLQRCVDNNLPLQHNNGIHGETVYICSECLNHDGDRANFKKCVGGGVRYCSTECKKKHGPANKELHNTKKKREQKKGNKKKTNNSERGQGRNE